jgi:ADP-ribose pyrophosphatase
MQVSLIISGRHLTASGRSSSPDAAEIANSDRYGPPAGPALSPIPPACGAVAADPTERDMTQAEVLCHGRWLRLMRRGRWEYAERTNAGGGVIIVAVTAEDRILFVEQWREAVRGKTIEMPAGLVGDRAGSADETAVAAAERELIEETGYRAGRVEFLMAGPSSAGMSNEIIAFVRARDLVREHAGGGDATENIIVHEIPRAEAAAWLLEKSREGYAIDPKLFAGLYFLDHADQLFSAR